MRGMVHSENISFNLKGNIVKCEDEVKLLGVTIDFQVKFNNHIANKLLDS